MNKPDCHCEICDPNPTMMEMLETGKGQRMIVCEIYGNKRCPHAHNHAYTCTNSNAPNQTGKLETYPHGSVVGKNNEHPLWKIFFNQNTFNHYENCGDSLVDFAIKGIKKGFTKAEICAHLSEYYRQCDEICESKYDQALEYIKNH